MKSFIKNKLREGLIMENRVKADLSIPNDILEIKDVFVKNGFKLFVVGGAVRDAILGNTPKDWDLATDAKPDQVERIMRMAGLKTIPTGKAFGVINVFTDDDEYEVATFRKDIGGGRRPDEVEFTTIEQDVLRRDLTINALFYDIDTNEIVDLVGGISDIKNGIVRAVGEPSERFGEDKLRVQRAIRFASSMGAEVDPAVDKAIKSDNSPINGNGQPLSPNRIRDEFLKGLGKTKSIKRFLELNNRYGIFDWIFPDLNLSDDFVEERDPIVLLAWLLRDNDPKFLGNALIKLTYTKEESKSISFLVSFQQFMDPNDVAIFKTQQNKSGVGEQQLKKFAKLIGFDQNIVDAFADFRLSVTGADAEAIGVPKGPEMGPAIKKLEADKFKVML